MLERSLEQASIPYDRRDIDSDPAARTEVERLQEGGRTIPTVVYPDGGFEVNPPLPSILKRLGLR